MNILLIAPDNIGINAIPETRLLSELHRVEILNGKVSIRDVYEFVDNKEFDVIHFATHLVNTDNRLKSLLLSNNEILNLDDVVQLAKITKAKLVFFNLCLGARFGSYISRRTSATTIFTTIELPDNEAWKLPLTFYRECNNFEKKKKLLIFQEIFNIVDDESGIYGIATPLKYYEQLLLPIQDSVEQINQEIIEIHNILKHHNQILNTNAPIVNTNNIIIYIIIFIIFVLVLFTMWNIYG